MVNQLLEQLKPWLAWLHVHPEWVGVATFLLAFVECLALIGLVVPGTVVMTAIGALIGSGVVSAKTVFISAMLGALLGDVLSFSIGYYYREHLRDLWPFKFYPRLLQKGESFFYQHGGKGVFVGRFIGPIRPMLPIIAGMLNMSPVRFFIADVISAIFWAPLYTLPGILLGLASAELAPDIAMHLMLYVILILLILWCISWLIKRIIQWVFTHFHRALDAVWGTIKHKRFLQPLHIALQDPLHPESHAQLTLGLYFVLISITFILLSINIITHGAMTSWNYPTLFFMRSLYHPIAYHILLVITLAAESKVWIGVFFALLIWFILDRAFRTAKHWTVLGILAFGGVEGLKNIIHSLRPWGLQVTPPGYSFPSGHVSLSAIFLGFLAVLISREVSKSYRGISYVITVCFVLVVAFSRLYLGAHWLTDVVGGMLFAMTIIMLVTLSYRRKPTPKLNLPALLCVFFLSFIIAAGFNIWKNYGQNEKNYMVFTPSKVLSIQSWWHHAGQDEPLFRLNRLGKPTQILNLQWAADIQNIQKNLLSQGWQISPNTTFSTILNRIGTPKQKLELPVVPQLYLDKRPALIMTKFLNTDSFLILMLWDSKTRFSDAQMPLWVGNISYYHVWESGYFHLHPGKKVLPNQSEISLLQKDMRQLNYPKYIWKQHDQILLIRESGEEN